MGSKNMENEIESNSATIKDLRGVLKNWNSPYIEDHLNAEEVLKSWGQRTPELLLELLETEAHRQKRKRTLFWVLLSSIITLVVALVLYITVILQRPELLGLIGMVGSVGGLAGLLAPSRYYLLAIQLLAQTEDVRFVGYLAEALFLPLDGKTKVAMARTLIRLLPQLNKETHINLTQRQRNALYRIVRASNATKETRLIHATLDALLQMQDTGAIPAIRSRATAKGATPQEISLREHAQTVLIPLEELQSRLDVGNELLRASSPISSEDLLRPAYKTEVESQEVLLRPAQREE